jgi:DNA-binding beta-propeller fold protein YncE
MKDISVFKIAGAFACACWVIHAQADLLVTSQGEPRRNAILRYSDTGAFLNVFAAGSGLADPLGVTFGPDGNLYVASGASDQVLRFDARSGATLGVFASGHGMQGPINVTFGPDGNLYVSCGYDHILRFNGNSGAFIDTFVSGGKLAYPRGLKFGPDGNLYVANYNTGEVLRFRGSTGAFLDVFVTAGAGDLATPSDLAFGPDGNLYVSGGTYDNKGVLRFDGLTGEFIDIFARFESTDIYPFDFAFGPDDNLYVVSQGSFQGVVRFDGRSGAFLDRFVPNGSGGLGGPFGIAFFPFPPRTNFWPSVRGPQTQVAQCGVIPALTIHVQDMDGDALRVIWKVNSVVAQTNEIAGNPAGPVSAELPLGASLSDASNLVEVVVLDAAGNTSTYSATVFVRDTTPPTFASASAQPSVLWPPNGNMVAVTIRARAVDLCGVTRWKIVGVESSEGKVPGRKIDWVITGEHSLLLRAQRTGSARSRVYRISLQATDSAGNRSAIKTVSVVVPHTKPPNVLWFELGKK